MCAKTTPNPNFTYVKACNLLLCRSVVALFVTDGGKSQLGLVDLVGLLGPRVRTRRQSAGTSSAGGA